MRLLALLAACLLLAAACRPAPTPPRGLALDVRPAAAFTLADQHGRAVSLSDSKGKVVVLTFLYATCQLECPLIAARLRAAHEQLGPDAARVAFLAISTDPEGDTPEHVATFLAQHRVTETLTYLTGARPELEPLWQAYYIAAESSAGVTIGHNSRILLLDAAGNERIHLSSDAPAEDIVHDVRVLLAE